MVDTIRKEVQNKLSKKEKKYFKHSRKLLLSRYENLKDEKLTKSPKTKNKTYNLLITGFGASDRN